MTGAAAGPLPGGIEVRRARGAAERDAAIALRQLVFVEEQGVPVEEEMDGRDGEALHLIATEGGEVVATCRLCFSGRTVQFSRLAVSPPARRRGIARALLAAADDEGRAAGARRVVLHAQVYARALYDDAGYVARGPRFWEAGIEHVAMEKRLG